MMYVIVGIDEESAETVILGTCTMQAAAERLVAALATIAVEAAIREVPHNPSLHAALGQWTDDVAGWLELFGDGADARGAVDG